MKQLATKTEMSRFNISQGEDSSGSSNEFSYPDGQKVPIDG